MLIVTYCSVYVTLRGYSSNIIGGQLFYVKRKLRKGVAETIGQI